MVNRNLKNIADAVGADKVVNAPHIPKPVIEGFDYVDTLGFYVAQGLTISKTMIPVPDAKDWYTVKREVERINAFLLTPAQMWLYWDYCSFNNLNDLSFSKKEWMDAIVEGNDLIVNSKINDKEYTGGRRYKNVVPKEARTFGRGDVSNKTGMPLLNRKTYRKSRAKYKLERKDVYPSVTIIRNPQMTFNIDQWPAEMYDDIYARECITEENMRKKMKNKEVKVIRW